MRLFNGFTEGWPQLCLDLYAGTLLVQDYADPPLDSVIQARAIVSYLKEKVPALNSAVLKIRHGRSAGERRGMMIEGTGPAEQIEEDGLIYAIDLMLGRDASFFLDTRELRGWLRGLSGGKTVLNAFAYTGSLGVAAMAGGARRVVQVDHNSRYLEVARRSFALNGFPLSGRGFVRADFFHQTAAYRRSHRQFDCVIVDPPFHASGGSGVVDLERDVGRLLRKVQPLVAPKGYLVAVNNALYVSGAAYLSELEALCRDGYLELASTIPVPEDFVGYPTTRTGTPVTDPAPFNHSTKIAVLRRVV
jgi:23S rRNA (cytosine1962-C5)-methyltransferase